MSEIDYAQLAQAADTVRTAWPDAAPRCGLILGSGWGEVCAAFEVEDELDYREIPGLGPTSVAGHAGRLLRARCAGIETLIFHGRRHWYEGAGWTPVVLPVYVLAQVAAETVVLTNAAGGVREDFVAGDLMLIDDHINLFGSNPLVGPAHAVWGERFPDMSAVYAPALRALASQAASEAGVELRHGTYAGLSGPCYETPAEVRAYRTLGADAVGMSTVPEATLAHAGGLRVLGLSCITNLAAGVSHEPLSHDDVTRTAAEALPRMRALLAGLWAQMR